VILYCQVMGGPAVVEQCYGGALQLQVTPDMQAVIAAWCVRLMFAGRAGIA
jgi:hypothetical protein